MLLARMAASAMASVLLLSACGNATRSLEVTEMELTSPAFAEGEAIPTIHTCDGDDTPPPLEWDGAPPETAAYALVVTDPDSDGFVHWVLADIPGDATSLPAGEGDAIGTPGRNDFGRIGWGGPCPPSGEHRYEFKLFALSEPLELPGTPDAASVESEGRELVLDQGTLVAVYARGG